LLVNYNNLGILASYLYLTGDRLETISLTNRPFTFSWVIVC